MERYKVVFGVWDNQEGKQIFMSDGYTQADLYSIAMNGAAKPKPRFYVDSTQGIPTLYQVVERTPSLDKAVTVPMGKERAEKLAALLNRE